MAKHMINAKSPNFYSAAITRTNTKIAASKDNDKNEESGNGQSSNQHTTNEPEKWPTGTTTNKGNGPQVG